MNSLSSKSVTTTSKGSSGKSNMKEKKHHSAPKTIPNETSGDRPPTSEIKLQPTAEQMRLATLMNDKTDLHELQHKVEKILELTGATRDEAVVALHDCDNNLEKAVDMILEGDSINSSEWQSTGKKKKTKTPAESQTEEELKPVNGEKFRNVRGKGYSRLQKGSSNKNNAKSKEEKALGENNENSEPNTNVKKHDRRGKGKGRGRLGGGGSGGGGTGLSGGRGARTFQNKGYKNTQSDGFLNSIDTWTNITADQAKTGPVGDCTTMTVGNWSDIAANEDWSEEDWDSNLMETKVFTPSSKAFVEKEEMVDVASSGLGFSSLLQKSGNEAHNQPKPTMSSIVGGTASTSAGAALLQQLQQSSTSQPSVNQYPTLSQYSKQATESIKSLVGIPSSTYSSTATNNITSSKLDEHHGSRTGSIGLHVDDQQSNKPLKIQNKRPTKIPESAVEMPSNDSISSLNVQFGALDFGTEPSYNMASEAFDVVNQVNQKSSKLVNNQGNTEADMSLLSSETAYRGATNSSDMSRNKAHASNLVLDNSVLGHQSISGNDIIERSSKGNTTGYGDKSLDSQKKSNVLYSNVPASMKAHANPNDLAAFKGVAYSSQTHDANVYGSTSYGNVPTNVSYVYSSASNPTHVGYSAVSSYSSTFPTVSSANNTGVPNQKIALKDLDSSNSQKYDIQNTSSLGLVSNSTMTTNVLKNSLTATGKGIANVPPGVTPLLGTQYIMGQAGLPAFLPYYDVLAAGARDHNFAYQTNADVKYSRNETDGTSAVSTQAPVSQSQPIFGQLPPGYGFFYTPGAVNMMPQSLYGTAAPLFPVQAPANTGSTSAAFPKGSSGFGSHSYGSGYDTLPPVPQSDYMKQNYGSSGQSGKGMNTSNTADLAAANQIYAKSHAPVLNSKSGYDKGYQTGTGPAPFNMGGQTGTLGASAYGTNPSQFIQMLPHTQGSMMHHSLQEGSVNVASGVGTQRNIGAGNQKGTSGTTNKYNYNWGV